MKVLFLDIDGVCNSRATLERFDNMYGIDPTMAARVQRIIAETGCVVVLSSTWRIWLKSREHVKKMVCDFVDMTPVSKKGFRGEEINSWLAVHSDVEHYAILDDDNDFYPGQPLFPTSFEIGLTDDIADQVIKYLIKDSANV